MRISDWSSDVCSSDLNERRSGDARVASRLTRGYSLTPWPSGAEPGTDRAHERAHRHDRRTDRHDHRPVYLGAHHIRGDELAGGVQRHQYPDTLRLHGPGRAVAHHPPAPPAAPPPAAHSPPPPHVPADHDPPAVFLSTT